MSRIQADLTGQVALVTGAGKGIGREAALCLARAGARVALTSRTAADLEAVAAEIGQTGGEAFIRPCDVNSVEDIYSMVEAAAAWGGAIDILVNSAGINIQAQALDVTEEQWDRVLGTNLKGAFFCCQAAGKKMVPRGRGKIINLTSTMAFIGYYRRSAYCSSKGGLSQLTKVLAVEWAPHNIQVNCVAPTFIKTPLTEPMFADESFYRDVVSRIPAGRVGEAWEVADAILFLASGSSDFMTGSTLLVDGGWVAW